MRTFMAVLVGIVLLSGSTNPDRAAPPAVAADTVTLREVRRGSAPGTLMVERPAGAPEGARSSVFVLDRDGLMLRRVAVGYGRASRSLIQIESGVTLGDRIVVSDMRAWDQFGRLQLRTR
jgi:hypothetical protein